ncbi:EamA family transporter [Acetobacter indonesiensis]|uniref:EamA family transporter n=1 Tax=Acetobacter indonesiensis TaxID=104101 RepID=UPI0039E9550C
MIIFIALLCVLGIASGQLLFKLSARGFQKAGSYYDLHSLFILFCAFVLYGITTLGWVWVLQKADLGRIYPLMALAFIIVPILCYFIFGESFSKQYFVGVFFIFIGVIMAVGSKN